MNEINDYSEPKEVDYQEKELTDSIKVKSILFLKFLLVISLLMFSITLFWSFN